MFAAHFTNTPLNVLMEMDLDELAFWYTEAVELHNELNRAPDG